VKMSLEDYFLAQVSPAETREPAATAGTGNR